MTTPSWQRLTVLVVIALAAGQPHSLISSVSDTNEHKLFSKDSVREKAPSQNFTNRGYTLIIGNKRTFATALFLRELIEQDKCYFNDFNPLRFYNTFFLTIEGFFNTPLPVFIDKAGLKQQMTGLGRMSKTKKLLPKDPEPRSHLNPSATGLSASSVSMINSYDRYLNQNHYPVNRHPENHRFWLKGKPINDPDVDRDNSSVKSMGSKTATQKKIQSLTHGAKGEGLTLPQNVWRMRMIHSSLRGKKEFNANGQEQDIGIEAKIGVTSAVLEYGVNDRLSLQLLMPYFYRNVSHMNAEKFRKSAQYKNKRQRLISKIANKLQANLICEDHDQCLRLLESGFALPLSESEERDGEYLTIPAGVKVTEFVDSIILNAAKRNRGMTGLGDIKVGALYNFFRDDHFIASIGAGVKLPTGSFTHVPESQIPTGGGVIEGGVRFNLDIKPIEGFWLSLQEQEEIALNKAKRYKTSLLDNSQVLASHRTYEYRGVFHDRFVQISHGLGIWHPYLKPLVLLTRAGEKGGRSQYIDGNKMNSPDSQSYLGLGGALEGLVYKIPLSLESRYDFATNGRNKPIATDSWTTTLKIYARF